MLSDPDDPEMTFLLQNAVETTYDAMDRKIRVEARAGGIIHTLTQFSYDSFGRLECTAVRMNPAVFATIQTPACQLGPIGTGINAHGYDRIEKNVYDLAGQLLQVRRAVGTGWEQAYATYTYTPDGKRELVIDAGGNKARMSYDGFGRLAKWAFPSRTAPTNFNASTPATAAQSAGAVSTTDFEEYGYDVNDNRTTWRKRDGREFGYGYDALNRLTLKSVPPGCPPIIVPGAPACVGSDIPAAVTRDVYYSYDLRGLQTYASFGPLSGNNYVKSTYDALGRQVSGETRMNATSRNLTYEYDAAGRRTRISHYDDVSSGTIVTTFTTTYTPSGLPLVTTDTAGNVIDSISYNDRGLPQTKFGGLRGFQYDSLGRLVSSQLNPAGTAYDQAWSYAYNPASQMITKGSDNDAYRFTGLYEDPGGQPRTYSVNGLNQYTQVGTRTYAHDANGNLVSDGEFTYVYDAENRLLARKSSGATITLRYDPLGRLYQITDAWGARRLHYDGDQLVGEFNTNGDRLNYYVHGPGEDDPLAAYDWGSTPNYLKLLHADHQGSIVAITDAAGNPQKANGYDEYGIPNADNEGRFQYTGQVRLPGMGLYYYKARFYAPTLGRFLQTDPIGYDDQVNLYAYVANDPVNNTDPDGQCIFPCAIVGALIDGGIEAGVQIATEGRVSDWGAVGRSAAEGAVIGAVTGGIGNIARAGKALGAVQRVRNEGRVMAASSRSKNALRPDSRASGPHSTLKRDASGKITNTAEYKPNSRNPSGHDEVKRVDVTGRPHRSPDGTTVPTPHVKEQGVPGVRPARPDELPR